MDEEREPEERPLGETHLGKGYGAGDEDVIRLVPPPDNLGIGAVPAASQRDEGSSSDVDAPEGATSDVQRDQDSGSPESGFASIDLLILMAFLLLLYVTMKSFKDDALGILALLALVGSASLLGYRMRIQTEH